MSKTWDETLAELPTADAPEYVAGRLRQDFVVPPWTVLMTAGNGEPGQAGALWQERKRAWLALGIQSELGRGAAVVESGDGRLARPSGQAGIRFDHGHTASVGEGRSYGGRMGGNPLATGGVADEPGGLVERLAPRRVAGSNSAGNVQIRGKAAGFGGGQFADETGTPRSGARAAANRLPVDAIGGDAQLGAMVGPARSYRVDLMRGEGADRYSYAEKNSLRAHGQNSAIERMGNRKPTPRQAADAASNVTGAPPLPDYVTDGGGSGLANMAPGTSIFDPVLCELVYRWWVPPGGTVLDPFAGGSVRGIVAGYLGHPYTGIDLSAAQIAANRAQAHLVPAGRPTPRWFVGDSGERLADLGGEYDLVFTCPPYYDLEVYSDDPRDLSALPTAGEFAEAYARILALAVARLRDHRFAVVVMGEARNRRGHLYGLVPMTIAAMEQAGAAWYNDAILVTAPGSLAVRTRGQFLARENGRKLGRQHQYVLVFVKGTPPTGEWEYARDEAPLPQQSMALGEAGAAAPSLGSPSRATGDGGHVLADVPVPPPLEGAVEAEWPASAWADD